MLPTINMSSDRNRWVIFYPDVPEYDRSLQISFEYSHASDFRLEADVFLWKDGVQMRVYMDHDEYLGAEALMEAYETDVIRQENWLDRHVPITTVRSLIVTEVNGKALNLEEAVADAMLRWRALELIMTPYVTY